MSGSGTGATITDVGAGGSAASSVDAEALDALTEIYETMGLPVVYIGIDTVQHSIYAIVTFGKGENYPGADDLNTRAVANVLSDDTLGIEKVQTGDRLTIGEEDWEVLDGYKIGSGLEWEIALGRLNR